MHGFTIHSDVLVIREVIRQWFSLVTPSLVRILGDLPRSCHSYLGLLHHHDILLD